MPIPTTGAVTMSMINTEFGRGLNLNAYRGTSAYVSANGALIAFSSGAISMSEFRGKQAFDPFPPPPPPPGGGDGGGAGDGGGE